MTRQMYVPLYIAAFAFISSASASAVAVTGPLQMPVLMPVSSHSQTLYAATAGEGDDESTMAEWSSFIGIITAVVGNVLISVALNIQRYAHIRIEREWEQEKLLKETRFRENLYGTTDERSGRERELRPYTDGFSNDGDTSSYRDSYSDEGDQVDNGAQSSHSDRTLRQAEPDMQVQIGNRKSYLRSPYWWAGIVLMTMGEAGNFLAYGFAPASIVSPLGVVALISNCVIAPFMLKERFRKRDLWGVLIAIAGAAVVVLSAKSSEEKIGPDEIWAMITRWEFELYLGISAVLIITLMWASDRYGSKSILIDVGLVALFGTRHFLFPLYLVRVY